MATSPEYVEYVCDQIQDTNCALRYRKMFGEYMLYANDKPILLVCDNTVFVKKLDCLATQMLDADCATPYKGAKEHYILDIENRARCQEVVKILEQVTPLPKSKVKKK